jgi:hypothetical protein
VLNKSIKAYDDATTHRKETVFENQESMDEESANMAT